MLFATSLVAAVVMPLTAPGQMLPVPAPPPPAPTDQTPASPQTPAPAREAPGAIYQDAMHPLAVVRASLDNWSEAELAALAVGMQRAREACDAAKPDDYRGEDLYDLAQLCAFGQDWSPANEAAQKYMASKAQAHETQAMAISVRALAHIGAIDLALNTTYGLLHFPYDADVAYTVRYMKDSLEHAGSPDALALAGEEHAAIVQALSQPGPLTAAGSDASISTGALYASAMELAFLNRFAGNSNAAEAAAADADAALQKLTAIPAEDQQEIDEVRTQYHLLGMHLPNVHATRTLQSASAKPRIDPNFGKATVLVLFSDWCIECRELVKIMTKFAAANSNAPIHVYGLLYPEDSPAGQQGAGKVHAENEKYLAGTPTLEVPAQTAQTFGVVDYPLGVVLDSTGTIRFIGVLPSDAFERNGYVEKVLERIFAKSPSKGN
jgi:thiol-disulfide isomerase/thioredoxin